MIKPLLVQLFSFHHDFGWLLSSVCLTYDSIFALFLGYLLSLILPLFRHKLDLDQYHQWHDGPQMEQGLLTHADVCPYISICALSLSLSPTYLDFHVNWPIFFFLSLYIKRCCSVAFIQILHITDDICHILFNRICNKTKCQYDQNCTWKKKEIF